MPRLQRLVSLALLFSARRRMRAEDVAERFGVSVRTVYRDIAALEEAGFPIIGTPGDGYLLAGDAHVRPLAVTPEEAEALVLAARLLEREADEGLRAHLSTALVKLENTLPPEARARLKRHHVTVRVPAVGASADPPVTLRAPAAPPPAGELGPLSVILDAVHGFKVLRVRYAGIARQDVSDREMEPLGLVRSGAVWLVPAWCRLRNDLRVFRSDRILEATATGEAFTPRPGATMEDITRRLVER